MHHVCFVKVVSVVVDDQDDDDDDVVVDDGFSRTVENEQFTSSPVLNCLMIKFLSYFCRQALPCLTAHSDRKKKKEKKRSLEAAALTT